MLEFHCRVQFDYAFLDATLLDTWKVKIRSFPDFCPSFVRYASLPPPSVPHYILLFILYLSDLSVYVSLGNLQHMAYVGRTFYVWYFATHAKNDKLVNLFKRSLWYHLINFVFNVFFYQINTTSLQKATSIHNWSTQIFYCCLDFSTHLQMVILWLKTVHKKQENTKVKWNKTKRNQEDVMTKMKSKKIWRMYVLLCGIESSWRINMPNYYYWFV